MKSSKQEKKKNQEIKTIGISWNDGLSEQLELIANHLQKGGNVVGKLNRSSLIAHLIGEKYREINNTKNN